MTLVKQKLTDALRALECARQNIRAARELLGGGANLNFAQTLDNEASMVTDSMAEIRKAAARRGVNLDA